MLVVAAFLTLALGVPAANASFDLSFSWWVNDMPAGSATITGTSSGTGMYQYVGADTYTFPGVSVNLSFDLQGKPDVYSGSSDYAMVTGNIATENSSPDAVDIRVRITLPITPAMLGSEIGGSAALGLTSDSGGGDLRSLSDTLAVWQALVDGAYVGADAAMFYHEFHQHNDGLGSSGASSNFGSPVPISGPAINESIGIELNFSLSSLDQGSFTSTVYAVPIPAPGGLVLLAAAGLVTRRRRRS
jgi:hypothetical protein